MIDIDKIEAAAKVADYADTVFRRNMILAATANPATVLEMVALIRKQREVMQMALDALESTHDVGCTKTDAAIKALEEALK